MPLSFIFYVVLQCVALLSAPGAVATVLALSRTRSIPPAPELDLECHRLMGVVLSNCCCSSDACAPFVASGGISVLSNLSAVAHDECRRNCALALAHMLSCDGATRDAVLRKSPALLIKRLSHCEDGASARFY